MMRKAGAYSGMVSGGRHALPLARIKKIMKKSNDEGGAMMISGEAPIVFSKACELLIAELTKKSWIIMAAESKRKTLHKEDVVSAIMATDVFDFLANLVSDSNATLESYT